MSYAQKEMLFVNGRHVLTIQPMVKSGWSLRDWIAYVDRFGRWLKAPPQLDSV